jgi:hypothetical protein
MANTNPRSPWRSDYRAMTRNENIAPRDFSLTVDGKPCELDEYQKVQKAKALNMRAAQRGSK